ncbi:MAG: metallopeptidase family protein, partial [Corynebacterium matruchotii]|uniref:metallopeptidase family protein n=1 Tax=Corynebacterium matruchotii TaxID=43768 RepID=UPI00360D0C5D
MMEISDERFEELVDQALAQIPDEVHEHIKNVVFLIEDYNPRSPYILGQYTGVALPKRTFDHTGFLPDTIAIYRQALKNYHMAIEQGTQHLEGQFTGDVK